MALTGMNLYGIKQKLDLGKRDSHAFFKFLFILALVPVGLSLTFSLMPQKQRPCKH